MHAYQLYRLNRPIAAAIIMAVAAMIGALMAPITLTPTINTTAPVTSAAVSTPANLADPAARAIATQQHVTLAQAEIRLAWQQAVPSLNVTLSRQLPAAAFGGIWIAPNDGDRVKIGVVGLTSRVRAMVMRAVHAVGLSGATDLVPVKYSLGQLVSADTWLAAQLDKLSLGKTGSIQLDASYRTDLNRVQLGVAGHHLTPADRALISQAEARYGDLVQVAAQPAGSTVGTSLDCTQAYDLCQPPLRAGIEIFRLNSQGQPAVGVCTGGFIASSRTNGTLYQFTAGHCAVEDGTGTWGTEFPDGTLHAIGTVHNYVLNSSGDEAILNINNPTGWDLPQGWVYVMPGSDTTLNEEYPISSSQYSTVGARVCETGASTGPTSGSLCGTVLRLGVTTCESATTPCTVVNNLGEASFCAQPGDSGAPVYAAHQAFGLVAAQAEDLLLGYTCVTYYQGIIGAANAMNVNIVLAH
jgi:hypothetical protein